MEEGRFDSLTPTQQDVLRLAADHSNDEIGAALGISRETVKTHLARAKAKLGGMDRGASSRRLRQIEAGVSVGRPPSRVNPDWGIASHDDSEPCPASAAPTLERVPDTAAVREIAAPFQGFPVEPLAEPRFHRWSTAERWAAMAKAMLMLAGAILVALVVGQEIQRWIAAHRSLIPH